MVALLRFALCYSVVPLRSAHKPIPYEDSKRMCQSNESLFKYIPLRPYIAALLARTVIHLSL